MNMWKILINGLPTQGPFKSIYDKQRRSTEAFKEAEAKIKRERYRKSTKEKKARLDANRRYKANYIEKHGQQAWSDRQAAYKETFHKKRKEVKENAENT